MNESIVRALLYVLSPKVLLYMIAGCIGGIAAGALPGISATMAVALIVPVTFVMDPLLGLATLGAIYMSAIYGGSFSAILINTPGTPSSIGTCFDGYPLARKGRGDEALLGATYASVFGGFFGLVVLLFLAPPLARVALKFGPPEYFWVTMFGLSIIASLESKSQLIKGLAGGAIGLLLSMVGIAPIGGDVRFTFGLPSLQGGFELVGTLIGFFCIPEVLNMVIDVDKRMEQAKVVHHKGVIMETLKKVLGMPKNLLRSSAIGVIIGIIPGAGGSIANLIAYNEEVRSSKHPELYGTGVLDGVVATESANNATVGGGLIPLLTLGVPGTPVDAVIFGALLLHGLRPGPELFTLHADITYGFIFSVFVATALMLFIGMGMGLGLYRVVSLVPVRLLAPTVVFLSIIGSYAIRNNMMDVVVMLGCGLVGFVLKELGFHVAPIVLGLVLGMLAEEGFVQSTLIGMSLTRPWTIFFTRPISILLILMTAFSLAYPWISERLAKRGKGAVSHA